MLKCNYCDLNESQLLYEYDDTIFIDFYGEEEIPICEVCLDAEKNYRDILDTERCLNNWIAKGDYCG